MISFNYTNPDDKRDQVIITMPSGVPWTMVLEKVECFLKAVGYNVTGRLEMVDEIDDTPEEDA